MNAPSLLRWSASIVLGACVLAAAGGSSNDPRFDYGPSTRSDVPTTKSGPIPARSPVGETSVRSDRVATHDLPANPDRDCAGVFYPLEVTVEPAGNAQPGLVATATLRVAAARAMGQVEVECIPGAGLQMVSERRTSLDRLVPGEVYEQQFAVRLPASLERRVVEITVRGWMNGAPIARSAIWNLLPAGDEVSREVIRPDGSVVREVAARRVR